ncbi:hypothetical protein [Solidesulfovibrio sp.]|uniref:hypothetical protein n=1 Tax=Solidesulfovibrio sp. TaxID=2910990 RepID=UPI002604CEF8|nr:hypothetical protein [Solidesulfovibrio sp.]
MPSPDTDRADLDIIEMPAKAVAAYWLSLRKLMDSRKGGRVVQEEMEAVTEPYIRLLLETAFGSGLPEETVRRLFVAGRGRALGELRRALDCMAGTLAAMVSGDNPQRVLSLLTAHFAVPPAREATIMERAYALADKARAGGAPESPVDDPAVVDHGLAPDVLLARLMYCLVMARREGREVCRSLAGSCRSLFFAEGLILVADGFDETFLRRRLALHRRSVAADAARKMLLAEEMCLGLRARYSYEDLWRVARAYLPA